MKTSIQQHKAGFSPVTLSLTFESEDELAAFKLRMTGHLTEVSVTMMDEQSYGLDIHQMPVKVFPRYEWQVCTNYLPMTPNICDVDMDMVRKTNKQFQEVWK